MTKFKKLLLGFMAVAVCLSSTAFAGPNKLVIAHRGASAYLPEHTMEAKAMAYAMDVDYIEQDVVMTKDNKLVVLHDHYLDRVTDVAKKFPKRARKDGRYYAIDFTLAEMLTLEMTEGFNADGTQGWKERFPIWKSNFKVHTLEQEIEMIQGLNKSTGKNIGIYPEIKAPWLHRHEGKDISKAVLKVLAKYGYTTKNDKVFLQCFDPIETKRIREELGYKGNLVQLIAETSWNETMVYKNGKAKPYNYDWMFKKGAMKKVAEYADGVGPWKPMIVKNGSTKNKLIVTDMVKEAHQFGMQVHPYTFRADNDGKRVPPYASSFEDLLDTFLYKVGVDGVFTDFPDRAVKFVKRAEYQRQGL